MLISKTGKIIFCSSIFIAVAAILLSSASGPGVPTIRWDVQNKLTWKDFKDTVITNSHRAALTSSGMYLNFQQTRPDSLTIIAYSEMTPSKSWVNTTREKSDYILSHEQYHFNITEYWCRKLKKDIRSTRFTSRNIKDKISAIQKEDMTQCHNMEVQYDAETNHSEIEPAQKSWEKKIDELLKSVEEYSDPTFTVPVK